MTTPGRQRNLWALGGVLFVAFFTAGDILRGVLAVGSLRLPGAPAAEVARYFTDSRTAAPVVGLCQVLSAISLFVFVAPVATVVRRVASERGALIGLASGGGVLAGVSLHASALLGLVLALGKRRETGARGDLFVLA